MEYTIFPKKGIGPIEFGMTNIDVRNVLSEMPDHISLVNRSRGEIARYWEWFRVKDLIAFYDENNYLAKVVVETSMDMSSIPVLNGQPMLDVMYDVAEHHLFFP